MCRNDSIEDAAWENYHAWDFSFQAVTIADTRAPCGECSPLSPPGRPIALTPTDLSRL